MIAIRCVILALIAVSLVAAEATKSANGTCLEEVVTMHKSVGSREVRSTHCRSLARRYDIKDVGYGEKFHGWADVQGQGAAHDYCRMVGHSPNVFLSCALAGTHGESEHNYVSATVGFDIGYLNTWYMKDEDGDGRDDYCRCVGSGEKEMVVCTKAGPKGFYGSTDQGGNTYSFTSSGPIDCDKRQVRPEFGRVPGFLI